MNPAVEDKELERPVGVVQTRALSTPRPALRIVRSTLPEALAGQLASGRELIRRRQRPTDPPLPTAEPTLDLLLAGGLARGSMVEVVGHRSSGRLSLVLTALAAATESGRAAVLIDLGDGLDPQAAADAGVDLERLLWLRPRRVKEALAGAEMTLATGFALVVVDLGTPPVAGGRGATGAWLRLARAARATDTALLVSAPYRVSGPAADAVLSLGRTRTRWQGSESSRAWNGGSWADPAWNGSATRLLAGIDCRLAVDKKRGGAPGARGTISLRLAAAPPQPGSALSSLRALPGKTAEAKIAPAAPVERPPRAAGETG